MTIDKSKIHNPAQEARERRAANGGTPPAHQRDAQQRRAANGGPPNVRGPHKDAASLPRKQSR